ncbi:hypothetical protein HID58_080847 [Brassica napus]|uniref:Importin subunit alpha n=1 Tax=Brassica napus TaxID=3708 RepID=A0ABQ7Y8U4_BRANA|nr:hypothetical protein HID58_080847 [Brassica napus]
MKLGGGERTTSWRSEKTNARTVSSRNAEEDDAQQQQQPLGAGLDALQSAAAVEKRSEILILEGIPMMVQERSPPIDEVIKAGVIPRFVEFLGRQDHPQLQISRSQRGSVGLGECCWRLAKLQEPCLSCGALIPLLSQLNENSKLSMLRNATWTLSNFCRGKPPTPFEEVKPALPVLRQLIYLNDEEVLTDACWALSYLSDGPNDKIQAVIQAGVCPRLVELLSHPSPTVLIPALRTVGNIVTGDDSQTQAVVGAGLVLPLVHLLQNAEFDIKKEAAWAISNATSGGSHEQIQYLVNQGCIKPICDLLICPDPRIVTVCLEGLENILKISEADKEMGLNGGVNLYAQIIEESDGLDKIENLQSHDNNEIYEKAVKILERYGLKKKMKSRF